MGFSIYFGKRTLDEYGNDSVIVFDDRSNAFDISYSQADEYFKSSENHSKLWNILRNGDINGADPVFISVKKSTKEIENLISNLTSINPIFKNRDKFLKSAFFKGYNQKGRIYTETR